MNKLLNTKCQIEDDLYKLHNSLSSTRLLFHQFISLSLLLLCLLCYRVIYYLQERKAQATLLQVAFLQMMRYQNLKKLQKVNH